MLGQSPMSQVSLRHAEYAVLLAQASNRSAGPALLLRERLRKAYFVAVRRAYVRARAARLDAHARPAQHSHASRATA